MSDKPQSVEDLYQSLKERISLVADDNLRSILDDMVYATAVTLGTREAIDRAQQGNEG